MPFACPFALCQWRCKPSFSLAHTQADEDDASVDGRYPGAGLIYVYVQVESERERECEWEREREWARQVFSSSPMCSLLLQREIERTQHDTCCSRTHRDSHSLSQSPLWSSRALPPSLSRMHTLCKLLLLLTHPGTFVVVALNSTKKKKKKRKMSRPQNQNHDATKATTTTTTAGVALFIVAVVVVLFVVVVFRIIVRYVLFVARYKTSLSRRCLRLLRRLSLVFSFNFVYFEFSQNFLEFLLHSHSLHTMAICCYSFSN